MHHFTQPMNNHQVHQQICITSLNLWIIIRFTNRYASLHSTYESSSGSLKDMHPFTQPMNYHQIYYQICIPSLNLWIIIIRFTIRYASIHSTCESSSSDLLSDMRPFTQPLIHHHQIYYQRIILPLNLSIMKRFTIRYTVHHITQPVNYIQLFFISNKHCITRPVNQYQIYCQKASPH